MLDQIPGMVGYWDRDMLNLLANESHVDYFGRTPDQIRGLHLRDLLGESHFLANLTHVRGALAGNVQHFEWTIQDVLGRTRFLHGAYIPDRRDGAVRGFTAVLTDVTDRVEVERRLEAGYDQYRALARSMPSGFVLVFDHELRYAVADGVELATFGYTREGLEGRTLHEALAPELAEQLEPRYLAALQGITTSSDRVVGHRTFKVTTAPVRSEEGGQIDWGMVTAVDTTEERRMERTWAALHSVATEVARHTGLEGIARSVASEVVGIFGVHTAAVVRYVGSGGAEVLAMAPAQLSTLASRLEFEPEHASAVAQVFLTGQPALIRYPENGGPIALGLQAAGIRSGAAAPIRNQGELWGAVAIATSADEGIDEHMVDQLVGFAELVELAVGNTEAWEALARDATTDELTGLPNRRVFQRYLHAEVERAHRYSRPLSLALMDLDHFKAVNDHYGHPVGDRVLAELGRRLRSVCREGEAVARLGGEEFGWLMPETDGGAAVEAAERLRRELSAPFDEVGRLTISVGVCSTAEAADDQDLVAAADEALYAAKRGGRDRVVVATGPAGRRPADAGAPTEA